MYLNRMLYEYNDCIFVLYIIIRKWTLLYAIVDIINFRYNYTSTYTSMYNYRALQLCTTVQCIYHGHNAPSRYGTLRLYPHCLIHVYMWLSQVEEVSLKHTLVSGNRRFCILAIQLDSRKSPEKNHRTWKRHVDQMESTGIGIDSRYLRDPVLIIPPASG